MFQTLLDSGASRQRGLAKRRGWVALGMGVEFILLGLLALAPLINTEALPKLWSGFVIPAPPPSPAGAPRPAPPARKAARRLNVIDPMKMPVEIPKLIAQIAQETEAQPQAGASGAVGVVSGGLPDGNAHGVWGGMGLATNPLPPAPISNSPRVARVRVGGQVEPPKPVFQPKPEYPLLAKMARIQGTVRLEAVIERDGAIRDLELLSGQPLLVKAAMEAVSRWRYQPTLLNGEPVEVITEIDVNFILGE